MTEERGKFVMMNFIWGGLMLASILCALATGRMGELPAPVSYTHLLQSGGRIFLSAITSGGSQAVFWKINIFGEEAFLDTIRETVENYII